MIAFRCSIFRREISSRPVQRVSETTMAARARYRIYTLMMMNDTRLLFSARIVRLFAYGFLSVVLVLYLATIGLDPHRIGLLLTLTLVGDVLVSLYLTTRADVIGRRRMLIIGSILMAAAGLAFACTSNLLFLVIAGTIGVISPSGNEVGPFLSIEQAALSHIVPATARTE